MILVYAIIAGIAVGCAVIVIAALISCNQALHSERNSHEVTKKALNSALRELREWELATVKKHDPSRNK